jgi:hypothetical protein
MGLQVSYRSAAIPATSYSHNGNQLALLDRSFSSRVRLGERGRTIAAHHSVGNFSIGSRGGLIRVGARSSASRFQVCDLLSLVPPTREAKHDLRCFRALISIGNRNHLRGAVAPAKIRDVKSRHAATLIRVASNPQARRRPISEKPINSGSQGLR